MSSDDVVKILNEVFRNFEGEPEATPYNKWQTDQLIAELSYAGLEIVPVVYITELESDLEAARQVIGSQPLEAPPFRYRWRSANFLGAGVDSEDESV